MKGKFCIAVTGVMLISLALSSCGVVGGLFATPTPTPTLTFTPTITPSVTPTLTPTDTPTPTATPLPTGSHVEMLEDGSSLYLDYDLGYGMVYPSTWYVIPYDSEDEAEASAKLVAVDASYKDLIGATKSMTDFIAVKPTEGNTQDLDGMTTGVPLIGNLFAQMPLQDALASQQVPEGATVVFNQVITNAAGVEMGVLEYQNEETHTVVSIFQTDQGAMVISLVTPTPKYEAMYQEIVAILNSIAILE